MTDKVVGCIDAFVNPALVVYGVEVKLQALARTTDNDPLALIVVKSPKNCVEHISKLNISKTVQFLLRAKTDLENIKVAIHEYICED